MATRMEPPTGRQFALRCGAQEAVVTEVGATLRSWRSDGRERLDTFGEDQPGVDYQGKLLAPWPNRIRGGATPSRATSTGRRSPSPSARARSTVWCCG
jgi:galactose mutarotase-like enzyme